MMSAVLHVPITNLTADKFGDVNLWIGQGKRYHNVPEYVSKELCCCTSTLPAETSLLPSPSLPVLNLLDFPTPPIMLSLHGAKPEEVFSNHASTHTSSECLRLPAPSHGILKSLTACAGQAMLDGRISVQHWDHSGIFFVTCRWHVLLDLSGF
jgi:hypothetical protein